MQPRMIVVGQGGSPRKFNADQDLATFIRLQRIAGSRQHERRCMGHNTLAMQLVNRLLRCGVLSKIILPRRWPITIAAAKQRELPQVTIASSRHLTQGG